MARKSNVSNSDGPSTAEGSGNEDVEMQDQDAKMSGFKKFGVSMTLPRLPSLSTRGDGTPLAARDASEQTS